MMRFFRPVPRVTLAQMGDTRALADLYRESWAGCEALLEATILAELTASEEDVAAWLRGGFEIYRASHDGRLVGGVRCSFPAKSCHIDRLAVHPDHRRRGFGQVLVEHVISRARRAGVTRVWARMSPRLDAAIGLYRGLGFRESGRHVSTGWAEPLVLLELRL